MLRKRIKVDSVWKKETIEIDNLDEIIEENSKKIRKKVNSEKSTKKKENDLLSFSTIRNVIDKFEKTNEPNCDEELKTKKNRKDEIELIVKKRESEKLEMQSVKTKEKSEKMSYSKKFTLDKCLSKEPNMTSNTPNKRKSKGLKCNISSNQSENIKNYCSPKNKVGLLEIKKK